MDTFKVGIIGCGALHSIHADTIIKNPKTKLVAVADIDENKAKETSIQYGCEYFTDYKELLKQENIDAVHICTPHYLHAPIAIEAMRAGKHVLSEKPMSISVSDAEELIKVSEQTGKRHGICFQNRYNTTSQRIKEVLASGKSGKILGGKAFVTWHRDENYYLSSDWKGTWEKEGGGVLINQAIHTLDLLQLFMGDIDSLKASIDTRLLQKFIEVEDTVDATIKFRNGATALFYATNCYCVDSPIEIELICENAKIKLAEELIISYNDGTTEHLSDVEKATGEKAYWGSSHEVLIEDFYNELQSGGKFKIDGEQGIKTIKIIQAIYESHKKGEYVELA
jgi:UDP-N-acetyl-2-amino-2-deoxyglucuronate dehydrogenase